MFRSGIAILMYLVIVLSGVTMSAQDDLLSIVESYQILHNDGQVDDLMELFTDDAEFELVGQTTLKGDSLQAIHDYDTAIDSRLAFINCDAQGNTVTCQVVEFNNWLEKAGLQPLFYTSSVFTLEDDKIARISSTMSPQSVQSIGETLQAFVPWLMANRAEVASPLFSGEGAFIYSYDNGELVLQLLSEWREAAQP